MKYFLSLFVLLFLCSCTSNTIYKKPKDLLSKDSLVLLLTDMTLATSARTVKNKNLERNINYMPFVFEKYKIDSARFKTSNEYYISKIDGYTEILEAVKKNIENLNTKYAKELKIKDSLSLLDVQKEKPKKIKSLEKGLKDSIVFSKMKKEKIKKIKELDKVQLNDEVKGLKKIKQFK